MTALVNMRPADESVKGGSRAGQVPPQVVPDRPEAYRQGTYTPWLHAMGGILGTRRSRAPEGVLLLLNHRCGVAAPWPCREPFNAADASAVPQVVGRTAAPGAPDFSDEIAIEAPLRDGRRWAEQVRRAIERAQTFPPEHCAADTLRIGGEI